MEHMYCLMFTGKPMNDAMRNLLFDTAQDMINEGEEIRTVRTSVGEGEVTTKNEQVCIGGMCGTVFKATLDTVSGSFTAEYVVRPQRKWRAADGFWT